MNVPEWHLQQILIGFIPSERICAVYRDLFNGDWLSSLLLVLAGGQLDIEKARRQLLDMLHGALSRIYDMRINEGIRGIPIEIALGSTEYTFIVRGLVTRMPRLDTDEAFVIARALTLEFIETLAKVESIKMSLGDTATISLFAGVFRFKC